MQNKGFVKGFCDIADPCMCVLSFVLFCNPLSYEKGRQKIRKGKTHYLDSVQNEKVWLGSYTLKQCREMEIGLGLDLKGGMNVILESFCTGCCKSFG